MSMPILRYHLHSKRYQHFLNMFELAFRYGAKASVSEHTLEREILPVLKETVAMQFVWHDDELDPVSGPSIQHLVATQWIGVFEAAQHGCSHAVMEACGDAGEFRSAKDNSREELLKQYDLQFTTLGTLADRPGDYRLWSIHGRHNWNLKSTWRAKQRLPSNPLDIQQLKPRLSL